MIDRKHYGIIAFPTSQAAAAAEAAGLAAGVECRLIPMPEQVSAGCGLVLQVSMEKIKETEKLLANSHIHLEGCYEVWFENRRKTVRRIV